MEVREPRPGEVIGEHYVIERELGRGGFGVVFQARHREIGRVVALKVMLATYAAKDPSAVVRFRREATIAAQLMYPNTVRVFDYGETSHGVFYLIMEFIRGSSLDAVIRTEGALSPRRAVHIIRQVFYALTEAKDDGIVHRDIKPENVMLAPLVYDPDFIKVMDFGIAKMVGQTDGITQEGITLGTPRYMPVEQLKGGDLSAATDIYAAGLVLYEMLAARPYFDGDSAVDIAIGVMTGPAVAVAPETGIPPALAAIIERCCARDAVDRYQSPAEVLAALDAAERDAGGFAATAAPLAQPALARRGPEGTLAMPSDTAGDGEDTVGRMRTMAVATGTGAPIDDDDDDVSRTARTQALATMRDPTPPAAKSTANATLIAGPLDETTALPLLPDVRSEPARKKPTTDPTRTLSLTLQAITLLLVLVATIRLFAG